MKIIHTADWHLGNVFHRHARADEHRHFLDWLLGVLQREQPDALLVAGDVFDHSNPPASAERQFYEFLLQATQVVEGLQVVVIAGNHDSGARLEAPSALLGLHRVCVRGLVQRGCDGSVDFGRYVVPLHARQADRVEALCLAIPYLRTSDYPEGGYTAQESMRSFLQGAAAAAAVGRYAGVPLVGLAHFYATGAQINPDEHSERLVVGGQDCVDATALAPGLAYLALGHIHKAQRVGGHEEIRYSGSALPMSFGERGYRHGVVVVEISQDGKAAPRFETYEPQRALLSLPITGSGTPEELLEAIKDLPRADKRDNGATWPYLELRVRLNAPDPTLQNRLFEALADKAVLYCRTVNDTPPATAETEAPMSLQQLQQASPLELAERFYRQRYDADMPDGLQKLFRQAWQETHDEA